MQKKNMVHAERRMYRDSCNGWERRPHSMEKTQTEEAQRSASSPALPRCPGMAGRDSPQMWHSDPCFHSRTIPHARCPAPRKISRAISPTFTPKGASCLERSRKNQSCAIVVKNEELSEARGKRYARKKLYCERFRRAPSSTCVQPGSRQISKTRWEGNLQRGHHKSGKKERWLKMFYCGSTSSPQASDLDFAFRIASKVSFLSF